MIRKVKTLKFGNTYVGEIVKFNGKLCKVVEVNYDVCARLKVLNFAQRFLVKYLTTPKIPV